jgi:hypothetical protein
MYIQYVLCILYLHHSRSADNLLLYFVGGSYNITAELYPVTPPWYCTFYIDYSIKMLNNNDILQIFSYSQQTGQTGHRAGPQGTDPLPFLYA